MLDCHSKGRKKKVTNVFEQIGRDNPNHHRPHHSPFYIFLYLVLFLHFLEEGACFLRHDILLNSIFLCVMCKTFSFLYCKLWAALNFAPLSFGAMTAAHTCLLNVFGAAWVLAYLSLCTVRDAKSSLYDTVIARRDTAFAASTFFNSTRW